MLVGKRFQRTSATTSDAYTGERATMDYINSARSSTWTRENAADLAREENSLFRERIDSIELTRDGVIICFVIESSVRTILSSTADNTPRGEIYSRDENRPQHTSSEVLKRVCIIYRL